MTTSDREGNFIFFNRCPPNDQLQVLKPGFETYRVPQVSPTPVATSLVSFTLQVERSPNT